MQISFKVQMVPVPQPRQRHRLVEAHGKTFTQNYTPKRDPVNDFKHEVRESFGAWRLDSETSCANSKEFPRPTFKPLEGPLAVAMQFYFPRPAYMLKKKYPQDVPLPMASGPDIDNLEKAVFDALNKLAWRDDKQICRVSKSKSWCAAGQLPGVEITIREMT